MKRQAKSQRTLRLLLWLALALTIALSLFQPKSDQAPIVEASAPHVRPVSTDSPRPSHMLASAPSNSFSLKRAASTPLGSPLFVVNNWAPPPPPPPPAPVPTAPPLPFHYMGKLLGAGMEPQVYLADNRQVYLVKRGEILGGMYQVEEIRTKAVTLTYLPLHQQQTIIIDRN